MTVVTSSALGMQDFFTTTLSAAVTDANQLTIYLNSVPTNTEGYLVIDYANSTMREIIFYSAVGANYVTVPADGRGQGGTTAQAHDLGADVRMNMTSGYFEALKDGTALSDGVVTEPKIAAGAVTPTKTSNPYKVMARSATDQSINDNTWTEVTFGTEIYDLNNNFATNAYTVPVTGYYQVNFRARLSASSKGVAFAIRLATSGTSFAEANNIPYPIGTTYGACSLQISDVFKLTAGEVISGQAWVDTNDSSAATVNGSASTSLTSISLHLLSL